MNRDTLYMLERLQSAGISPDDARALRRASMTLRRWFELECGTEDGAIEQDEASGRWYWYNSNTGRKSHRVADRETGARRRVAEIVARYPGLSAYIQTDPRGASVYILRPGDVPEGKDPGAYYSNGLAVYA
jgi:hypothetical protein